MVKGLKMNKKTLLNTAIACLVVRNAPRLINKVYSASGITADLLAGAVGVAVGVVLKSEIIQNVSVGVAVSNIVSTQLLDGLLSPKTVTGLPIVTGPTAAYVGNRNAVNTTNYKNLRTKN